MEETIYYTTEPPHNFEEVQILYEALGWNSINLTVYELELMCHQSWFAIYAFDNQKLVGMGRVISDGVITGIICGLGVLPHYQSKGVGKEMMRRIIQHCEENRVIPQLMCVESLESYYKTLGFKKFAVGMMKNSSR